MSRRIFAMATAATALMGGAALAADTMIFATDLPPTHFVSTQGAEPLMACISEGTGGEIDFNYLPSGQLVKRNEMVDGLNKGLAQFAFAAVGSESANLPLQGVTMLPGMSPSAIEGTTSWREALDNGGALADEFAKVNVKPLQLLLLAPYQIMGTERLDDVADWQGQKVRATGSALTFLTDSIGASAVTMSGNDMFVALQRGTVDATVLSFASVKPYSIHEVATSYSANMSLGTSASLIGMNQEFFDSLPAETQKVIDDCGRSTEIALATWVHENEGSLRQEMVNMGHDVYELTDEQLAGFAEKLAGVEADFVGRLEERGLAAQQAVDEFKAALSD